MGVEYTCCEAEFFIHIAVIVLLVLFAGLMSGLTLGLMSSASSISKSSCPQPRRSRSPRQVWNSKGPDTRYGGRVTLPISSTASFSAWVAILVSVTLILLFGEAWLAIEQLFPSRSCFGLDCFLCISHSKEERAVRELNLQLGHMLSEWRAREARRELGRDEEGQPEPLLVGIADWEIRARGAGAVRDEAEPWGCGVEY
ncbi:hypothetical protein SASPL_134306 [Salvia splendens]|uniref:Uncharacterized protein n=1 Tax=Salvia splendens TaxID=180675 RepID=A0A8X8ZIS7_SALSN|nr:hypothetical protein SASPL_134306 [Salvia splendens]